MADHDNDTPVSLSELLESNPPRRLRDLPSLISLSLRMVWTAARREFIITSAVQILISIGYAVQVLISKALVEHLLAGRNHGYGPAVAPITELAVVIGVVAILGVALSEVQWTMMELVSRFAMRRVIDVSTAVDLSAFELPQFHDRQQRAYLNASSRPLQMTNGLLGLLGSGMAVTGVGIALLSIQPLFVLLVGVGIVPLWFVTVRASRAMYEYNVEQTERDRRRFYLQMLLTNKESAKEVRAYDNERFLTGRFDALYAERISALRAMVGQRIRRGMLGAAMNGILTGAALGLIVVLLAGHELTLPEAGAAAAAIVLLTGQLQSLTKSVGSLYESSLFIRDFTTFVDLLPFVRSSQGQDAVPAPFKRLRARGVSFRYPSREVPSLDRVSIDISAGQIVALVGANGSGKTTLAKVLAGLYPATEGVVEWDGIDLASFAPSSLREHVAILFQDFVRYHLSAFENIAFGNHHLADDQGAVYAAAMHAGAHDLLSALPSGYETLLGPEYYGGSDLSGGQWQRVALARAFLRDAELIIMDEPTASLDPRSEADLYANVRELFHGRSVLLISHRLASVRLADYIYVLDAGRIVEEGTHDDLMRQEGQYAQMFRLQAAAYGVELDRG
jgi:ATP-binding cassette subfamily B protein